MKNIKCFLGVHSKTKVHIDVKVSEGTLKIFRCMRCHQLIEIMFFRSFYGKEEPKVGAGMRL